MKTVKIIRSGLAEVPTRGTAGAAAVDLRAMIAEPIHIRPQAPAVLIPTGIRLDMSAHPDICALILPRSGLGHKNGLVMGNGVGLIDSDYQGEIMVSAWNRNPETFARGMGREQALSVVINPGDRIAQLIFLPTVTPEIEFETVDAFEETERGEGGFGSTGVSGAVGSKRAKGKR